MGDSGEESRLLRDHEVTVSTFSEIVQLKQAHLRALSDELAARKLRLADLSFSSLAKQQRRSRATSYEFSLSMGIVGQKICPADAEGRPEAELPFERLDEAAVAELLALVAKRQPLSVTFESLPLSGDFYQNRDSFSEHFSESVPTRAKAPNVKQSRLFRPEEVDAAEPDRRGSDPVLPLEFFQIRRRERRVQEAKGLLVKGFLPSKYRGELYACLVPNSNQVDANFAKYYAQIDSRMPRYVEDAIETSVQTLFCSLKAFDPALRDRVLALLRVFYNFRSDVGYKPGLEVYALLLCTTCRDDQALVVFVSLLLDFDLLFSICKGVEDTVNAATEQVMALLAGKKGKQLVLNHRELLGQFFLYMTSNFFVSLFEPRNLRGLLDLLVLFGDELFTQLFAALGDFLCREDLDAVKNCYQLEQRLALAVKGRGEDALVDAVRRSLLAADNLT